MNIIIFQGPELSEALAQARGLGGSVAASGKATPEQLAKLNELSVLMQYLRKRVDDVVQRRCFSSSSLKAALEADSRAIDSAVGDAADQVASLVASRGAKVDSAAYFAALTRSVESIFSIEEHSAGLLDELLTARIARFRREIFVTLAWVALGLLLLSADGTPLHERRHHEPPAGREYRQADRRRRSRRAIDAPRLARTSWACSGVPSTRCPAR